jgi:hypothetical protein
MLTVVHDTDSSNEGDAGRSLLDEIVRDGARQMLAAALQAEVAAYVEGSSSGRVRCTYKRAVTGETPRSPSRKTR